MLEISESTKGFPNSVSTSGLSPATLEESRLASKLSNPSQIDLNSVLGDAAPFSRRHIGPGTDAVAQMLQVAGLKTLDALVEQTIPSSIRLKKPLDLPVAASEAQALAELKAMVSENRVLRSFLGMGYSDTLTPGVIQRNILENPGWYTQYTPYQAEIAQGRLEALLNFQTMVTDLTALEIANASLLDEGTAAAEAMAMAYGARPTAATKSFFVAADCHPQTIEVVRTRAIPLGVEVVVGDAAAIDFTRGFFGILLQYPATDGRIVDYTPVIAKAHEHKALAVVAADILSLVLLKAPGEMGADIAVGNTQRFGVPLGFGGPHAGYLATREAFSRRLPGRLVGVSRDRHGRPAARLTLQTREQHIRRDKATSNICTAQVLLAVMASMYAVYHGPEGLKRIALRTHALTVWLAEALRRLGYDVPTKTYFDTIRVETRGQAKAILAAAEKRGMNLRRFDDDAVGLSLDETTTEAEVATLIEIFSEGKTKVSLDEVKKTAKSPIGAELARKAEFLTHPVFHKHRSETEMLRYIRKLESKDLSLTHSMIPLGSCTMKLNATAELFPVTWPEINRLHPFAPEDQTRGYRKLFHSLERWLAEITGFAAVSLQPNSGAQGEYAGLLSIREYHRARGNAHRDVCLIPKSAHGTNPASAAMAGMKVVVVECDADGNVDVADLKAKAEQHRDKLSALMITYPSTHGVFEEGIRDICAVIHERGGQVYMDGANLNAQVGLCRPGDFGPDVCHLNLHKTFCIPHGGGGPGIGPIAVAAHLAPFLPSHPVISMGGEKGPGPISAAPWGSASILPISWMYLRMMGGDGLKRATEVAILNANYAAKRLAPHYPILYKGRNGLVAHECIIDLRDLKKEADIEVDDVAKRLMDYGFHAPTISWPVAGTMMVEPTESESKEEIDRFVDAMIAIREEVREVASGKMDRVDNVLKNAPHTAFEVTGDEWNHPYTRDRAAFPSNATRERKFWPSVGRIDNVYGDRNLFCSCAPVEDSAS